MTIETPPSDLSKPAAAINTRLEDTPEQYEFFQALRVLECLHSDWPRLGESRHPADDFIRLGQATSLAFQSGSIDEFRTGTDKKPARLNSHCLGLLGPNGPLPLQMTELALDRARHVGDDTLRKFLDVFHHRMLSLFYRAWANANPAVQFDRPESDRYRNSIGSLFGAGIEDLQNRNAVPDADKLHYAGRLATQTRNAEGLEALLEEAFGVPAVVQSFAGHWLEIPAECHLKLGTDESVGTLGQTATIGGRVWDRQSRCEVNLGPVSFELLSDLLPGGTQRARLADTLRMYLCDELACDVSLELPAEEVPTLQLGAEALLGQTTWLPTTTPPVVRRDVVLRDEDLRRTRGEEPAAAD